MESVLRAVVVYFFLLLIIRISGKRTLSDVTTFDFVLLIVVSEATQQGLLGNDFSMTNAAISIITLVFIDIVLSLVKQRMPRFEDVIDGKPVIVVEHGKPLRDRMRQLRIDEDDVMNAARRLQGLERMEQIKYAVMEVSGGITIIPEPAAQQEK